MSKIPPSSINNKHNDIRGNQFDTRKLTVKVFSRVESSLIPVDNFEFIVNENNVGDPQVNVPPGQLDESRIPSLKPPASHSPVVTAGDSSNPTVNVPDGDYLVSVKAPGHKIGGNWVTVAGGDTTVNVELLPHPLPLSKIQVFVFHDNQPVNGEPDIPSESGLQDFQIIIEDAVGELTVDYFGNPLGTEYYKDSNGKIQFDGDGNPVPVPNTGGTILSDVNGYATVENIPPGKYGVQVIPPDGTDWVQTTTIEGTHVIDAWVEEGNDGTSSEFLDNFPIVWFGFVRPMEFSEPQPGELRGTITGQVRTWIEFETPGAPQQIGPPVERPWIALTDIGGNDQQVYLGRHQEDGSFTIKNVPPGIYQMAIWDNNLDYIISFRTVQMPDLNGSWEVVVEDFPGTYPGQIAIPRWYGWIKGRVFIDTNKNAICDSVEKGMPQVEVLTHFKDGTIQYTTVTDNKGNYSFDEVFELEHFTVAEVGFSRLGRTGISVNPSSRYPVPEVFPNELTAAVITWAGKTNYLDFGKIPYLIGENGGISGMVRYATVRNEYDPRFAAAEGFEPGIPGVTVNLYQKIDGALILINSVTTDDWEHPINCVPPHETADPNCIERPSLDNQIRPGTFDGGYAFEEKWILDSNKQPVQDPETGELMTEPLVAGTYYVEVVPPSDPLNPLPDGSPRPLYKILTEESINTDQGDQYVINKPSAAEPFHSPCPGQFPDTEDDSWIPAPPCAGDLYLVQDPRSPFNGEYRPLCNMKKVVLEEMENAVCDFYLYTEVPIPGRMKGWIFDDVNIETDPNFLYYGGKRGVPYTPVGIRNYLGKLLTTVFTDKNGVFEVLLPSTQTTNIPTPSGIAPHMYRVIGNDAGDPKNPNIDYNPNYRALHLVFDIWPGKTTYADVALFPITAFVEASGSLFSLPPQCNVPEGTPQIFNVNRVVITDSERNITINGSGFGSQQGSGKAMLNNDDTNVQVLSWNDTSITVEVLPAYNSGQGGTAQLLITNNEGRVTPTGITVHILGTGYQPQVLNVKKDGSGDYASIQEAINAALGETLIVVHPGIYYENPIIYTLRNGTSYRKIRLQGMGPGSNISNGGNPAASQGSVIDGRFFAANTVNWRSLLDSLDFDRVEALDFYEGQTITLVARDSDSASEFSPLIDGFKITGANGGSAGGIYINAYCRNVEISNNIIQSNGGMYGGGITIGRPYVGNNHNDNLYIHHNRILNNGGINLAGAIAIFNGADEYEISHNQICGNYSAEYGGGISHFGLSDNGSIHHNCITFNASFDEGAGIFIGGELPTPPAELSAGSGRVAIFSNKIQGNLANDDGGGIRLLQPTTYEIKIFNNMIVNNISTDLGGGIALDDASQVVIFNNTIAKNISTATAEDSDRLPHGAGLISEIHSAAFQALLPPGSATYSNPVLFNNIFWDNRAYYFNPNTNQLETGGSIDLEVFGTSETLEPNYCSLTTDYSGGSSNYVINPDFIAEYDTQLRVTALFANPDFKTAQIITAVPELEGDYHINSTSQVIGKGTGSFQGYDAPPNDIDGDLRGSSVDIGADQHQ